MAQPRMSLFWRHKGTAASPRLEPESSGFCPAAEVGKGGPILPDHEPVVKTASTGGGLLHSKTPTMSRLGTIDWPSFEDPILVTPVTDLSAVVILSDCPPIYGPANYIRLVRRPGSPRLSNVQTFYGRQTLHSCN